MMIIKNGGTFIDMYVFLCFGVWASVRIYFILMNMNENVTS